MPHKHRRNDTSDPSIFDLPPTSTAKPLPVKKPQQPGAKAAIASKQKNASSTSTSAKKRRRSAAVHDDTPKEFARLMRLQATGKRLNGLDDGDERPRKGKKRQKMDQPRPAQGKVTELPSELTIMPGERLQEFNARVNFALPVSGLVRKGKKVEGVKERRTKLEKRMQKMHAAWRAEDTRRKDKEEELREEEEETLGEWGVLPDDDKLQSSRTKGKKGKRKLVLGEKHDGEEDPWEVLKMTREQPKGLHDVAQAPPDFKAIPKEKFKIKNNARVQVVDIPRSAGSLRQREELSEARKGVIERYRNMMGGKHGPS